jgi:hypothetical protein
MPLRLGWVGLIRPKAQATHGLGLGPAQPNYVGLVDNLKGFCFFLYEPSSDT